MSRYINPHTGMMMHHQPQQPMQQQYQQNVQQQYQQQMQQMRQPMQQNYQQPMGLQAFQNPDGSIVFVAPNGRTFVQGPDGQMYPLAVGGQQMYTTSGQYMPPPVQQPQGGRYSTSVQGANQRFSGGQPQGAMMPSDSNPGRYGAPSSVSVQPNQPQESEIRMQAPAPAPATTTRSPVSAKNRLLTSQVFTQKTRTRPFDASEIQRLDGTLAANSLDELIETVGERALTEEIPKTVVIGDCVVNDIFHHHDRNLYQKDLFENDIKSIYKVLKTIVAQAKDRHAIAFLSAYNAWLTKATNEYLALALGEEYNIESFHDDFNSVLKFLRDNHEMMEDELIDCLNDVVSQAVSAFEGLGLDENTACVPEHCSVVYVNLLSTEMGLWNSDSKQTSDLIQTLAPYVGVPVFYLTTVDKAVFMILMKASGEIGIHLVG